MYEKLVENWLTSVNELSFQLPFCEVLLSEGYVILHVSSHGPGEHGKDVIARRGDGVLCTFQLKGGDIKLAEWRNIRGEVEELARLPVRLPGIDANEPRIPHLVTNGEISGDALESIQRFSEEWEKDGARPLEVVSKRALLKRFLDAHGKYLPNSLNDFRTFVELYVGVFEDRLPREKFARFLEAVIVEPTRGKRPKQIARALAGLAILSGYVLEQYERAGNHLSAVEGWTITASVILHVAEREGLVARDYVPVLSLLRLAAERNLDALASEALSAPHWVEPRYVVVDSVVYGVRALLLLGWLAIWALDRASRSDGSVDHKALVGIIAREFPSIRLSGEADWPLIMALSMYLERRWFARDAEYLVTTWVNSVLALNADDAPEGVPSPYWTQERAIERATGMLAPRDTENFGGRSFTLWPALDMLVRRLRRQFVKGQWDAASRVDMCSYMPSKPEDYLLWRCEDGELEVTRPPLSMSWSAWRTNSSSAVTAALPQSLIRHPEWLLPFLATYPHRANRLMCALADSIIAGRCATETPGNAR